MSSSIHHMILDGCLAPAPSLEARRERRKQLERLFAELSRRHPRTLRTPMDFSVGESFQALIREPSQLPALLADLHGGMRGENCHLGLGWGPLSTPLGGRVRRMDGPGFDLAHRARIEAVAKNAWTRVCGFGDANDEILNGQFLLWGQVQSAWKPKQRETIALMRRLGRRKEVAAARGVLPSTVTRSLEGAFYDGVLATEKSLSLLLLQFCSAAVDPTIERSVP